MIGGDRIKLFRVLVEGCGVAELALYKHVLLSVRMCMCRHGCVEVRRVQAVCKDTGGLISEQGHVHVA